MYSDTVAFLVGQLRKEYGHCLIIDLHSYDQEPAEYELHKNEKRPKICIGTNKKTDETLLATKLNKYNGIVGFNEPFSGSYIPENFINDKYVISVMIEMRKDYCNDSCNYNVIYTVLNEVLKALSSKFRRME